MSLQVWLPLTGDLHNQGLANIDMSLASGNTFITTDSKIGHGSLTLTQRQLISSTAFNGKKQISWALWVKVNTAWSAQWLDGIYWITSDGSTTDANRQEFYTNCTKVGMWYKGGSISGYNFTPGVWTHLAGTVDYENGHAAFYINGIQQGSTTNNVDTTRYITSVYIGDSGVDIQENDIRIYDHILSKKEIEEISKGLVLHYKLDQPAINNIIYDSSGFQNNGIVTGDITLDDANTIRYENSSKQVNGSYIRVENRPAECMPKDAITVNLWQYATSWYNPISCTEGGGWNFENSSGIRFPVYISGVGYKVAQSTITPASTLNAWHMLTGTMDKDNIKIYYDGQEVGTVATDSTNGIGYANNYIFIGGEASGNKLTPASSAYVGNLSDVRIYATALTAEQILELYHTSASIDNNGNIYARELVEE